MEQVILIHYTIFFIEKEEVLSDSAYEASINLVSIPKKHSMKDKIFRSSPLIKRSSISKSLVNIEK